MAIFDNIKKTTMDKLGLVSKTDFNSVIKKLNTYARTERNTTPVMQGGGEILSRYEYSKEEIYNIARNSDILTLVHKSLRGELFRNGFEVVEPDNIASEINTEKETDVPDKNNIDTELEQIKLIEKKKVTEFIKNCNSNNDNLKKVLKRLEDDVNILDQQFALFIFDYSYDTEKKEYVKTFKELDRANPQFISLVINKSGMFGYDDDRKVYFDPRDRTQPIYDTKVSNDGFPLFEAWYRVLSGESNLYYAPWEIWYNVRYRPEIITGYSPVMTLKNKVFSLYYQDKYINDTYQNGRPPKGLLAFMGVNKDRMQEAWEDLKQRAQENPNSPGIISLPPAGAGSTDVKFVDFMKTLDEMQFGDVRDEMRRLVGAIYGVSPIFENDVSASGGLNNEGLQITVTNRAVEDAQSDYNEGLMQMIVDCLGVKHWTLRIRPSEEQDEMAKLERQEQSLRNGELAVRLGLEAEFDSNIGEVVIKSGTLEQSQQDTMGGFGNEQDFSNNETDEPDSDISGSPDLDVGVFKSKKKLDLVYKALPKGAISLGKEEKAPEGYQEIKGPKGGRYAIPSKNKPTNQDIEEGITDVTGLNKLAEDLYNDIPQNERKEIENSVKNWLNKKDTKHLNSKDGVYTEERRKIQTEKILKPYLEGLKQTIQTEKKIVFMSGLPASGKTTATKRIFKKVGDNPEILEDKDGHKYCVLNNDDIKALLPEYTGKNAAELHEESSDLNKILIDLALRENASIIIDGTLKDYKKAENILNKFKEQGYKPSLINIDVSIENSIKRAKSRYDQKKRFVPFDVIIKAGGHIKETVENLKNKIDSFIDINNDGEEAVYK